MHAAQPPAGCMRRRPPADRPRALLLLAAATAALVPAAAVVALALAAVVASIDVHTSREPARRMHPTEQWVSDGVPRGQMQRERAEFPRRCALGCHAGHCDGSLGTCVCLPGWRGVRCDDPYLSACKTTSASITLTCEGFASVGFMSCDCQQQCLSAGLGTASVRNRVCFIDDEAQPWSEVAHSNRSSVRYWRAAVEATSRQRVLLQVQIPMPYRQGLILPLPGGRCAQACSGNGACVQTVECHSSMCRDGPPFCACHVGFEGSYCEISSSATCLHGCHGHGRCVARMCLCDVGWWGLDCQLNSQPSAPVLGVERHCVPIFVYPLPAELEGGGYHHLYQGGMNNDTNAGSTGFEARGVFEGARAFISRLHSHGHIVADPERAALYVVPVLLTQKSGNLWHPQDYLHDVVQELSKRYPFWNRSAGADHIFFTTQDLGGCWIHPLLRNAIIISHFGFVESLPFWMSPRRWRSALEGLTTPEEPLRTWPVHLRSLASLKADLNYKRGRPCNGSLTFQAAHGCFDPFLDHRRSILAREWTGRNKWLGPCYNRTKDIVAPTDFTMTPKELVRSRVFAAEALKAGRDCVAEGRRNGSVRKRHLIFMSGRASHQVAFYSQGVRQAFFHLHRNTPGVLFRTGKWHLAEMRESTFCLCPSGWGFGWRLYLALATLCIPVVIQPMVEQAYHDLLPYHEFTLTFSISDIPLLPQMLRAVPPRRVCELRAAAARYYRFLLWQKPDGLAYEMLEISLCRRALALNAYLLPGGPLPPWANCGENVVDRLLVNNNIF